MRRLALAGAAALAAALGAAWAAPVPEQAGLHASVQALDDVDWKPLVSLPPGALAAVLSEDPVTSGIEALVRFPKGYAVPEHWHRHAETILVVKGRLIVTAAGKEERLGPGDRLSLPATMVHALRAGGFSGCIFHVKTDKPFDFFAVEAPARRS